MSVNYANSRVHIPDHNSDTITQRATIHHAIHLLARLIVSDLVCNVIQLYLCDLIKFDVILSNLDVIVCNKRLEAPEGRPSVTDPALAVKGFHDQLYGRMYWIDPGRKPWIH